MKNCFKKLARYSLKQKYWGNYNMYIWVVITLALATLTACKYFIDFSTWNLREISIFAAIVGSIFIVLTLSSLIPLPFIAEAKGDLPELVIPEALKIRPDNPQYHPIIDRLIMIATNDDDAYLLRQWLSFFAQKKGAEERMRSFEMQFLSKG